MLDLVVVDGQARGIVVRNLITGEHRAHAADAVVLCTGGYGNVFYSVHQCHGLQRHRHLARLQEGRLLRQSLFYPDPPDLHSGARRLPVQTDPDERKPAKRRPGLGAQESGRQTAHRTRSRKRSGTITWKANTPASAIWFPGTWPPATPRNSATMGKGVGDTGLAVYLDFADAIKRDGRDAIEKKYGNLFRCTKRSPPKIPTRRP